ncbi:MAG: 16S rRNA (guanine(527)-N(7))-methyltransferase RsmG [Acutalibacteraceae bacterium]
MKNILPEILERHKIFLTDEMYEQFETYYQMLTEWNEKINLTAITEKREVAIKHFADSLLIAKYADIKEGALVIDIGTGAGFPGIPLKIYRPDIELTLLDSLNKRLVFLEELCKSLKIKANIVHMRAEEGAKDKNMRENFDFVTSRAVANMNVLSEYCLPYVKVGGVFAPMKGKNGREEFENAKNAVGILGGKIKNTYEYSLTGDETRIIGIIEKVKSTSPVYPRQGAKIKKKPL